MANKLRGRELGLRFQGTPGQFNAITDVPGVLIGQTTLDNGFAQSANPALPQIRTGVTAILPFGYDAEPRIAQAGMFALNGNGEMTGSHWIRDAGYFWGRCA